MFSDRGKEKPASRPTVDRAAHTAYKTMDIENRSFTVTELPVTWNRTFKVWWLLLWRSLTLSVLGGGLFGAFVGVIGGLMGMPQDFITAFAQATGFIVGNVVFLLVIRTAFWKRFKGFRLAMVADEVIPAESAPPPQTGSSPW
jgi:hypothetical protein